MNIAELENDVRNTIDWLRETLEEAKAGRIASAALTARNASQGAGGIRTTLYMAAAEKHNLPMLHTEAIKERKSEGL